MMVNGAKFASRSCTGKGKEGETDKSEGETEGAGGKPQWLPVSQFRNRGVFSLLTVIVS